MKKVQILQQKVESQHSYLETCRRKYDELKAELSKAEKRLAALEGNDDHDVPLIYIVTPTHNRLEQKADLTRFSYTLRLVKNVHWIIIEDSVNKTDLVKRFLANCKVPYTHLFAKTPDDFKLKSSDPNWLKPRGVLQRNEGLKWIRTFGKSSAVVYFADDDNTYDLKLFEEVSI